MGDMFAFIGEALIHGVVCGFICAGVHELMDRRKKK